MCVGKESAIDAINTVAMQATPNYEGREPWRKSDRQGMKKLESAIVTFYKQDGCNVDYNR